MVLGCLDGWFGRVDAMVVRLDHLGAYIFFATVILYGLSAFVVEDVQFWLPPSCF